MSQNGPLDVPGEDLFARASGCLISKDLAGAIDYYRRAAQVGHWKSIFYLAAILQNQGQTDEADHWWQVIKPGAPGTLGEVDAARLDGYIWALRHRGLIS